MTAVPATVRFLRQFARPGTVVERELRLPARGATAARPASAFLPSQHGSSVPVWILLHGVTVPGRHHLALRRMARSLAAAGHAAIVPEVTEWSDLQVRPAEAERAVGAALEAAERWSGSDRAPVGLMGFSVAATWALQVAAGPLGPRFAAVVGMGGYGSLDRMLRAMVTGEHEQDGRLTSYSPDPYGRWILGAELLPHLDGDDFGSAESRRSAGEALRLLALTAGRNGAAADEPVYDCLIGELRAGLPAEAHRSWDILAPPSSAPVADVDAARALASALAEAGRRIAPELDPSGRLDGITVPVTLLHGRADRLIPYTETPRLAAMLPAHARRRVVVTRLLGHTKATETALPRNPAALALEAWRFAAFIHESLAPLHRAAKRGRGD